ncbi:amidase signature domain-containing protein [Lasiosphaeria ovina]|uniref:Amidase signature domain-containing protein n=1 Tax=Lasiosphaeria ovina TaxID=92902 RepID=A0AAE0NBS8_9PEZI|nr:amidase signature domain-containing protein [Lasiosphaeria ovina]
MSYDFGLSNVSKFYYYVAQLLSNRTFTSLQLTKEYLRRIALDDKSGLQLHAMLELTPIDIVLGIANERDLERWNGILHSPLHGIPLIIKGNMATDRSLGMKTTSGAYAIQNATASRDAFMVEKARKAGMIVIGKANLGELNGFKDNNFSLAAKHFHPTICSTSAGRRLDRLLPCPASFTALYGLKVSTGLLSRSGILASSTTFDSPGIFAKSAWDIAALPTETSGYDPEDPNDFRIGVADKEWFRSILPGFVGDQADIDVLAGLVAVAEMGKRGATIVQDAKIRSAPLSVTKMGRGFAMPAASLDGVTVKFLKQLIKFNREHPELSYTRGNPAQGYLESALNQHLTEEEYNAALLGATKIAVDEGIVEALDKYNLDVLVLPAWTEMSIYAAWALQLPQVWGRVAMEMGAHEATLNADIPPISAKLDMVF